MNPEGLLSLGVLPVPSFLPLSLLVGGRTGWQDAVGEGPAHVSPLFSWQGLHSEQVGQLSWQVGGLATLRKLGRKDG